MTLHDAMIEVLRDNGKPMTGQELSDEIIKRKTYFQKEGGTPTRSQIELRTKNYPQYFVYNKSCTPRLISLVDQNSTIVS